MHIVFPWPRRGSTTILGLALSLGACQSNVVGPSDEAPTATATFAADVQPLFVRSCTGCHGAEATSGVDLSTHAATLASVGTQYGEAIVRPGDAANSPLVDKIEAAPRFGARMPQGMGPLTGAEIARVRAWIDAGALDD